MSWLDISTTLLTSGALMLQAGTIGRLAWPGGRYSASRPLLTTGLALLPARCRLAVAITL